MTTLRTNFRDLTLAAGILLFSPSLTGAEISWDPPFNLTNANQLDTTGTLVSAVNVTGDSNNQTVTVGGEAILFSGDDIAPSNTNTGNFFTGDGGDTNNAQLNNVLNSHGYASSTWSLQLTGLTAGADYQIQLLGAGDTRDCCSNRNQRAGDDESPENISGDFSRSGVGSVIGTFTAGGTTQTINILPGVSNGTDPGLSGYIVRAVAPPTPLAPTDIALSNTDLAPNTASGTLVGNLSTSDPNGDNAHTYSLIETGSFPDNALFTIINGNELRAASTLGSFGTSYTIRLRTTDGDSLTYDETFTLNVEAAMAPTAIAFPSNTVLLGTPVGTEIANFTTEDTNSADTHSYQLVPGAGDSDNALFTIAGNTLQVGASLPGLGSTLSFRVRSTDLSGLNTEQTFTLTIVGNSLRINEFLANPNASSLTDEDGDTSDWIELHNPAGGATALNGYHLTDDPENLTKWSFPNVSINGNGYLLVFASNKDRSPVDGSELHTNFSLSANGEYLALVSPDGTTILSEFGTPTTNYPEQKGGVSYGFFGDPLQVGFLLNPTPDDSNATGNGVTGFVEDTSFATRRGFYNAPFSLAISTATPGASIRYTTDGSWPSETTGTLYTGPITVDRAMSVKAIAYRSGYIATNVDTHTYIIPSAVLAQTPANIQSDYGLPSSWGGQAPYYGMNGNSNANPANMADDLVTVPSLSIAIDTDDMFGSSGIYSNPGASGSAWERKTSLEIVDPSDPTGAGNFQQNCAIRIQGGAFRSFGLTRKKSFRVLFKSQFGTNNEETGGSGTLKFPLFGTDPGVAREFQTLIFRMESNDGWQWSGAGAQPQYARDEFGRRTQLALGQPAPHGRYLHLYINGVYWGLYNVVERPDSSFAESYVEGAVREEWEGQNSGSPINDVTSLSNWNNLLSAVRDISSAGNNAARDAAFLEACGFNSDGTRNPAYPVWCDPSNNADYFITNWYAGNSDWPNKNYYGGIDALPPRNGYKYFMWDSEWSLFLRSSTNYNRITNYSGIAAANDGLQDSPEFRLRFGDRVHRAFFNDGALTPEAALARYEEVTADHTSILNPEAARWGNQHGGRRSLSDWQGEYNRIVNDWFPARGDLFLDSLRSAGLYPNLTAPSYSQHGGSVAQGSGPNLIAPLTITKVYYTFGSGDSDPTDYAHSLDPRLVGGGINPAATLVTLGGGDGGPSTTYYIVTGDTWKYLDDGSNLGTTWRDAAFDDSTWESGPSQLGYGDNDEATRVSFVDSDPDTNGTQKNATTYFRTTVNIPDPATFGDFTLGYLYDDGVVVYVNGVEVARKNLPLAPAFNTYATDSDGDNATDSVVLPTSAFLAGINTIAVEVHQDGAGSSDMSFDLTLTGNPPGGGGTHSSAPIPIDEPGWLFSRTYDSITGEWSALNSAFFTPDTVPASAANLVISEINYHPGEPATAAEILVSTDRDDYEFLELKNVATQSINLTGVRFTLGITFNFADNTILPPGGRIVIVKNRAAFDARYPGLAAGITIATDVLGNDFYSGRLSNSGEQLTLLDANDDVIHDFTYSDVLPWPLADGSSFSLVLKSPALPVPDHGLPTSWVSSNTAGGAPGSAAEFGFTGDPDADEDHDGHSALIEYTLGSSDNIPGDAAQRIVVTTEPFTIEADTDNYLVITYVRNLYAQNAVTLIPQLSYDLANWGSEPEVTFLSETNNLDGTATVSYRSAHPVNERIKAFIRLRAFQ
ncbi:lamin tail domain-containing protein [Verrucomicrobiaceae bacterium 227]